MREAPLRLLRAERERIALTMPAAPGAVDWELAGPTNVGGRCTSILCDPQRPDHIYLGAAGGGVWESNDAGATWRPRWDPEAPLQIGALAMDPQDPTILYCGTGEANLSADSYPGNGVYRSTDSGLSWQLWAGSSRGLPRRIGSLAIDPTRSNHVLVGGVGYQRLSIDDDLGGLYTTSDGGATWVRETFVTSGNYWCHQVVFDPATPGLLFATVTGPGAQSGIYRSTDGGASWAQLRKGLPDPDRMGRASLALAPSDPRVIYALCADAASGDDGVLGVFKSPNQGNSWTDVAGHHFAHEGQMSYGNSIAVHPTDPGSVICGGVDLHRTTDGGKSWRIASRWDDARGTPGYAHADHHGVLMPSAAPGRVYSANDGGLDLSEDGGRTWTNRSAGLPVTMYYDVDVAQTDARLFGGGAQDNGTLVTVTGAADDAFELLGGDGGWMVIDPREAGHVYASYQFGGMYRFRNGSRRQVTPPFKPEESGGIWMVYITFDPVDQNTVYTGNQRVYRTRNDGISWAAISPVLDASPISAIEVAPADVRRLYVGTENGGFFRSGDGGSTWSGNLANGTLPGVMITRVESHPNDAKDVLITVGNFGSAHVFHSRDAGSTWADLDGGQLPDVPHHSLLRRPDRPDEIWVANDAGVFVTGNAGKTWLNATGNLPPAMVVDLVFHMQSRTLLAATYGRSIWRRRLS